MLLHRFQQRRLGLWRRPVDLVGEQHVGEHGSLQELEKAFPGAVVLLQHLRADNVAGHKIRRELDTVKVELECLR